MPRSFGTILACAGTNAAADNLAEGLVAAGVRTVRVGQPAKVRARLQDVTLDALTQRTVRGRSAAKQLEVALEVRMLVLAAASSPSRAVVNAGLLIGRLMSSTGYRVCYNCPRQGGCQPACKSGAAQGSFPS